MHATGGADLLVALHDTSSLKHTRRGGGGRHYLSYVGPVRLTFAQLFVSE